MEVGTTAPSRAGLLVFFFGLGKGVDERNGDDFFKKKGHERVYFTPTPTPIAPTQTLQPRNIPRLPRAHRLDGHAPHRPFRQHAHPAPTATAPVGVGFHLV